MARPTLRAFKSEALKRKSVKQAYDELTPGYEVRKKLIALRQKAGLTQEQVAQKLHTSKSNISRLESVESNISPRLSTITDYAEAIGYKLEIDFVPSRQSGT
jgi:DNA-binding XRE family transcriptional regulator